LIGADAFKETEFRFIAHPEVNSVVVGQMCVPMAMQEVLKTDMVGLKASVKMSVTTVKKLESKMARQATEIAKLQQVVKVALKNKCAK
jgi:hypothetical protein